MRLPTRLGIVAFWLSWPGLWLYLRWSQRTRLLIVCEDEILVTKTWLGDGRWSLPGGGLHRREDKTSGLLREVREEIGLTLQSADIEFLRSELYRSRGLRFMCHYYTVQLPQKPALDLQRFEITDASWVNPKQVTPEQFGLDVHTAVAAARL
ncbi:MAG TPA: NUDIX domain-containing protein [Candidatus Saccharimonadales bacterium]|jgi:8-oxo-dGTP pyrophosphatase MutT (NUDIX family)